MAQAAQLGADAAVERIVRVASVAGFVDGNPVILKVRGGYVGRIVDVKTFSVRLHDVAGEAEGGLLGALDVIGSRAERAEDRQNEKSQERKDFAAASRRERGPNDDDRDQNNADNKSRVKQGLRTRQSHQVPPLRASLRTIASPASRDTAIVEDAYFFASRGCSRRAA